MEIRPILSTLRRHKTAAALIVLEIALSCAIVCNALFLISERLEPHRHAQRRGRERSRAHHASPASARNQNAAARHPRGPRRAARASPAWRRRPRPTRCRSATRRGTAASSLTPDQTESSLNADDLHGQRRTASKRWACKLVAGRDFTAGRVHRLQRRPGRQQPGDQHRRSSPRRWPTSCIPGENAVGKTLYCRRWRSRSRVVGVVDTLVRPNVGRRTGSAGDSMLLPVRLPYDQGGYYVLRTDARPARRGAQGRGRRRWRRTARTASSSSQKSHGADARRVLPPGPRRWPGCWSP